MLMLACLRRRCACYAVAAAAYDTPLMLRLRRGCYYFSRDACRAMPDATRARALLFHMSQSYVSPLMRAVTAIIRRCAAGARDDSAAHQITAMRSAVMNTCAQLDTVSRPARAINALLCTR